MSGDEHYREAERLLAKASDYQGLPHEGQIQAARLAQVHATLALAAAKEHAS